MGMEYTQDTHGYGMEYTQDTHGYGMEYTQDTHGYGIHITHRTHIRRLAVLWNIQTWIQVHIIYSYVVGIYLCTANEEELVSGVLQSRQPLLFLLQVLVCLH